MKDLNNAFCDWFTPTHTVLLLAGLVAGFVVVDLVIQYLRGRK